MIGEYTNIPQVALVTPPPLAIKYRPATNKIKLTICQTGAFGNKILAAMTGRIPRAISRITATIPACFPPTENAAETLIFPVPNCDNFFPDNSCTTQPVKGNVPKLKLPTNRKMRTQKGMIKILL